MLKKITVMLNVLFLCVYIQVKKMCAKTLDDHIEIDRLYDHTEKLIDENFKK